MTPEAQQLLHPLSPDSFAYERNQLPELRLRPRKVECRIEEHSVAARSGRSSLAPSKARDAHTTGPCGPGCPRGDGVHSAAAVLGKRRERPEPRRHSSGPPLSALL